MTRRNMTPAEQHARIALDALREAFSNCPGSEKEAVEAFADIIGAEVDGWSMRADEIQMEDEDQ